jgi:predicted methyltransferase
MRGKTIAIFAAGLMLSAGALAVAQTAIPANIAAAVANPARPQADRDRDALRKPAETMAFAGIANGQAIGELIPGGGYFTRLLSKAVGPTGTVYALITAPAGRGGQPPPTPAVRTIAADPGFSNVVVVEGPLGEFKTPKPLDLVWTSQNYHDMPADVRAAVNKAALAALKPGGVYLVLDHSSAPGAGLPSPSVTHRADEALTRSEVTASGFTFDSSSDVLRNPADDRTKRVFDADVRAKTDQFILKFRKPR